VSHVFVAGGTGFIGREVVRRLVVAGHRASVLARSDASAGAVRALGGEALRGDLLERGAWRDEAARADHVLHLAQPETFGAKVTRERAEAYRANRLTMDENLLGALDATRTKSVVYVAGTSYYGHQGKKLADEGARPRPRGFGPYLAPAIDALERRIAAGLRVVTAFPGYVYGAGSWFEEYVARPIRKGRPIHAIWGRSRWASPVHVDDCARALVHLLERGEPGRRYFVVDDEPLEWHAIYERAAEAMNKPLRVRKVPAFVVRMLVGPVVTESALCDARLSNARLRDTGFVLSYPTTREGIPAVVRALDSVRR
jgi:nucleoside-diphosphate-sugar epimerase